MDVILPSSVVNSLHSTSTPFISFSVIYACMLINFVNLILRPYPRSQMYIQTRCSAQEKRRGMKGHLTVYLLSTLHSAPLDSSSTSQQIFSCFQLRSGYQRFRIEEGDWLPRKIHGIHGFTVTVRDQRTSWNASTEYRLSLIPVQPLLVSPMPHSILRRRRRNHSNPTINR